MEKCNCNKVTIEAENENERTSVTLPERKRARDKSHQTTRECFYSEILLRKPPGQDCSSRGFYCDKSLTVLLITLPQSAPALFKRHKMQLRDNFHILQTQWGYKPGIPKNTASHIGIRFTCEIISKDIHSRSRLFCVCRVRRVAFHTFHF